MSAPTGRATRDWQPGIATRLDRYVTRILAPNAGLLTGRGTNTYLVGERDIAVIDPGPEDPAHLEAILAAGAGQIRWIVLTHTHPEHSEAAELLRELSGAALAGCAAELQSLAARSLLAHLEKLVDDGELEYVKGCYGPVRG